MNKLLAILLVIVSLVGCDLMLESKNPLSSIEESELNHGIRNDTILQGILLGMHRTRVDSILINSTSFSKSQSDYYYQFSNIPTLKDVRWRISNISMYYNDSLMKFNLISSKYEFEKLYITASDVFSTLCYNYKIKYGEPKYIKDRITGPYYWIDGNREIVIYMYKDRDFSLVSISYEDLSRQKTSRIEPTTCDEDLNTYTQTYWDKIKSKELKEKLKTDL
jgi:hypothetical protein